MYGLELELFGPFFFFFFNSHVVDLQCCASLLAVAFLSIQILRAPGVRAGC